MLRRARPAQLRGGSHDLARLRRSDFGLEVLPVLRARRCSGRRYVVGDVGGRRRPECSASTSSGQRGGVAHRRVLLRNYLIQLRFRRGPWVCRDGGAATIPKRARSGIALSSPVRLRVFSLRSASSLRECAPGCTATGLRRRFSHETRGTRSSSISLVAGSTAMAGTVLAPAYYEKYANRRPSRQASSAAGRQPPRHIRSRPGRTTTTAAAIATWPVATTTATSSR